MKIHEALIAAKNAVGSVGKDQKNTQQHYSYRGRDAVVNAVAPFLAEFGVLVLPIKADLTFAETSSAGGKKQGQATGTITYRLMGAEGDYLDVEVATEATDFADKATAKAMTVGERIMYVQVLSLPTDDPDADADYTERGNVADALRVLRESIFAECESSGIESNQLVNAFRGLGGKGKIGDCRDEPLLTRLKAAVETMAQPK
ncbi:ERF family protein [Nocardia brasiliensis]|uniref:ERF family protein n=1 Tax=Nocardia brasiliensis TaxID=37326 RepID=UPI0024581B76|nr:ERF family protein [Nocardia brasiliensis]